MVPEKKVGKAKDEDWFAKLEAELSARTDAISKDKEEINFQKTTINRAIIGDFWNVLNRFSRINVQLNMEPTYSEFAQFEEFPLKCASRTSTTSRRSIASSWWTAPRPRGAWATP